MSIVLLVWNGLCHVSPIELLLLHENCYLVSPLQFFFFKCLTNRFHQYNKFRATYEELLL